MSPSRRNRRHRRAWCSSQVKHPDVPDVVMITGPMRTARAPFGGPDCAHGHGPTRYVVTYGYEAAEERFHVCAADLPSPHQVTDVT